MQSDPDVRAHAERTVDDGLDRIERHVPDPARPHVAILLPTLLGALLLGLLAWGASRIYTAVLHEDRLYLLDQPVLDEMVAIREPWLNTVMGVFTQIGGTIVTPILALVVVLVMCRLWRSWLPLTIMVAAGLGSVAVTVVGKQYIDRVRPPHALAIAPFETSPSFPSGHSLNAVVVAGVVSYLLWRRTRSLRLHITLVVLAVVYAAAMGLSRVYLGHHWLTDVMTGWLLGGAWLAVVITTHVVTSRVLARRHDTAVHRAAVEAGDDEATSRAGDDKATLQAGDDEASSLGAGDDKAALAAGDD